MSIKVRAVYHGNALHLKEPLNLAPGTEVWVIIEPVGEPKDAAYSFFRWARANAIDEGPTDWSTKYEEYLYPDPPRSTRSDQE
jgi:hypothetical protein